MKEIQLTQGKIAIVDDEDYEWLSKYHWRYNDRYAYTYFQNDGKRKYVPMHHLILHPIIGMEIDHINHNGLDNRRTNLRICTHSQNMANSSKHLDNTSGHKGVYKQDKWWVARIGFRGGRIYLGIYNTVEEAAAIYDAKARELFDEFVYSGE